MIDHLGGGHRFGDLLSLARAIDLALPTVRVDLAVFAHETDDLLE